MYRDEREMSEMAENLGTSSGPEFTGRQIVIFKDREEGEAEAARTMGSFLRNKAGVRNAASVADLSAETFEPDQLAGESVELERLGIAVVEGDGDREVALATAAADPDSPVEAIVPERIDRLFSDYIDQGEFATLTRAAGDGMPAGLAADALAFLDDPAAIRRAARVLRFLMRLSDAVSEDPAPAFAPAGPAAATQAFADTAAATWGLIATRVPTSRFAGRGVRVAVLDTGFDAAHRDFVGRRIVSRSVVPGVSPQDVNGHGTHCIGTACGSQRPASGPRYGVAHGSEIFSFKVFNNAPEPGARRGDTILAMGLANRADCKVVSMSLGSTSDGVVDPEYARAIAGVRRAGTLVIAAAGNSARTSRPRTGSPANSPDAVSVGAVDPRLRWADFSSFGKVELSAPGVDVLSSVPGGGTRRLNGTSMATPHVAGIAALLAEQNRNFTPEQLELALLRTTRSLAPQPSSRVGRGLVQAPQ